MNRKYTQANEGDCHSPPTHNIFSGLRNDDLLNKIPSVQGDCHSPPPTHNIFSGLRNNDLLNRVPTAQECDAKNDAMKNLQPGT